jgi:hypothetical protein
LRRARAINRRSRNGVEVICRDVGVQHGQLSIAAAIRARLAEHSTYAGSATYLHGGVGGRYHSVPRHLQTPAKIYVLGRPETFVEAAHGSEGRSAHGEIV